MKEIIPNLWLGDRFDAEQIGEDSDWLIICIADFPEQEFPKEPKSAEIFNIFSNRDPEKHYYGSDWHEDPDLEVDIHVLSQIACKIRTALEAGRKVLVHCVGGVHRSPLVVAWYLYIFYDDGDYESWTVDKAYDLIILKRPEVARRIFWLPEDVLRRMYTREMGL